MGASVSRAVCIAAGITYPAYASFKALESPRAPQQEKQWLTYWVVYGVCTSMETAAARLVSWLPGYYFAKTLFLIWMMFPRTKGAMVMYRSIVRPLLKKYEPSVDRQLCSAQYAAEDSLSSLQRLGGDVLAQQLESLRLNDVVACVGQALRASTPDPDHAADASKKGF